MRALATHPEQCTHVHDAETCVGEGQQDTPGKSLEIRAKPGADGGAEFTELPQGPLWRTAVAPAASQEERDDLENAENDPDRPPTPDQWDVYCTVMGVLLAYYSRGNIQRPLLILIST
jgi:hypothetical protein